MRPQKDGCAAPPQNIHRIGLIIGQGYLPLQPELCDPPDQPLTQTLTQGLAKVGDVMVSVEQTTIDMQRKPGLDGFTDYFEKAISAAKN